MGIPIKGIEKLSTIDYPGKTCTIAWLAGCNFKCPYCQNPDLIGPGEKLQGIAEQEFLEFVRGRKKWIDGVCVSGGEPTLHRDLPGFVRKVKEAGFLVKLDTNGTNPGMLKELIADKVLDYIAMDIKSPQNRYPEVASVPVNMEKIEKSIKMIMNSGAEYEFRTTVVPGMHTKNDILAIGTWIKGARKYYVQGFRPDNCLDKRLRERKRFTEGELRSMSEAAGKYVESIGVRV